MPRQLTSACFIDPRNSKYPSLVSRQRLRQFCGLFSVPYSDSSTMQVTIMMVVAALKASLFDKSQCHRDASLPVQAITAGKPMVFGKKNIAAHLPASHKARSPAKRREAPRSAAKLQGLHGHRRALCRLMLCR